MIKKNSIRLIIFFFIFSESCSSKKNDIIATKTILYKHEFKYGHGGWGSPLNKVFYKDLIGLDTTGPIFFRNGDTISVNIKNKVINDFALIQSPFFYDINHSKPLGAGSLYLLTWLYLNGDYKTSSTIGIPFLDLRDTYLTAEINIHDLNLIDGNLLFWFQTTLEDGRWANYALTSKPIDKLIKDTSDSFQKITIKLPENELDGWVCLGASERETHRFACNDKFISSISKVNFDFGLIIFPIKENYAVDHSRNIKIKSIEIFKN